jgi:hypothetical protein
VSGLADDGFRRALWGASGASNEEADELVAYAGSPLHRESIPARAIPLPDAPCVAAWERYVQEAKADGVFAVLRRVLVQLRFPIQRGMSGDPEYQAATRRGVLPSGEEGGLTLTQPQDLRLFLHPTPAGRVPVLQAAAREDFEALVQAITCRNEPEPVPASMGACMIASYNNWERVGEQRRAYERLHPDDWMGMGWAATFRELIPQRDLYQDRFMLLSSGLYSSTAAGAVGMADADWRTASATLRLAHESTHYFMREAIGSMRKSLLDELVADYVGLVTAVGRFRADFFLTFMGLESHPSYREGGRFQNYRGSPPLSDGAYRVLAGVVKRAAESLERLESAVPSPPLDMVGTAQVITSLTRVGLEGLAADDAPERLAAAFSDAARSMTGVLSDTVA